MSSQLKEKLEEKSENNYFSGKKHNISAVDNSKVNLNDLVSRLNTEKKKERNQNIILSVAAVSVVTVFGVILAL
jgi:hypothetical protein|tara:strand:+ start:2160 stop:2381 length:222 start_codon:yes stop_codon:yes gene_type:complete